MFGLSVPARSRDQHRSHHPASPPVPPGDPPPADIGPCGTVGGRQRTVTVRASARKKRARIRPDCCAHNTRLATLGAHSYCALEGLSNCESRRARSGARCARSAGRVSLTLCTPPPPPAQCAPAARPGGVPRLRPGFEPYYSNVHVQTSGRGPWSWNARYSHAVVNAARLHRRRCRHLSRRVHTSCQNQGHTHALTHARRDRPGRGYGMEGV